MAVLKSLMPAVQRISDRMERMVIAGDVAELSRRGSQRWCSTRFKKAVAERQEKSFQRPRSRCATTSACCSMRCSTNRRCASEIVAELKSHRDDRARFLRGASFRRFSRWMRAAAACDFEEVHARLEEADQNLLAQAVLGDDMRGLRARKCWRRSRVCGAPRSSTGARN